MFFIRKSKHSNLRFYKSTSKFFSFKKKKKFTFFFHKNSGKNKIGHITVNHKKNGLKNKNIVVNYYRNNVGVFNFVIETVFLHLKKPYLSLVKNKYNSIAYFIQPSGFFLKKTMFNFFFFSKKLKFKKKSKLIKMRQLGNLIPIFLLKANDLIINIVNNFNFLLKIALSSGCYIKFLYKTKCDNFCYIELPSLKKIKIKLNFFCVLGRNSNKKKNKTILGGVSTKFKLGFKPSVRGVAMNPVDHPNGGRTKTNKPEKSPWGWVAKKKK